MNWGSVSAFLAMGGYGVYVWGSYAMTALCIAIEVVVLVKRDRRLRGVRRLLIA
jgi:heme exporter protein D